MYNTQLEAELANAKKHLQRCINNLTKVTSNNIHGKDKVSKEDIRNLKEQLIHLIRIDLDTYISK